MKNKTVAETRKTALTVPCMYCYAPAGQECTNTLTQQPLVNLPSHFIRLKTAQQKNNQPLEDMADAENIIPLHKPMTDAEAEELF
jgi:hypothetical protein